MLKTMARILTAVSVVSALLGAGLGGRAEAANDLTTFRNELLQFVREMRSVARTLEQQGAASQDEALADAEQRILMLTPDELAILRDAFARNPAWKQSPAILNGLIIRKRTERNTPDRSLQARTPARLAIRPVASPARPSRDTHLWRLEPVAFRESVEPWVGPWEIQPAATPDDCTTARSFGWTQTDVEIAADAVLVLDIILEAIPTDLISVAARVAVVALWAVPQGFLRGIEHNYNIAGACDDADHQNLVVTNLDVKVSTRATQASVGGLQLTLNSTQNQVTALQSDLTSVQSTVNNIQTGTNTANTSLAALQTSVNTVQGGVNTANTNLAALQTSVNTVQAGVNTANTKLDALQTSVNTANVNILTLTGNVASFQSLSLRLQIEANLALEGNRAVGLFQLPASRGGHLDLVRAIVADIIQTTAATGQSVGNSPAFLSQGDQLLAAGNFKNAYDAFGQAYRAATN